MAGQQLSQSPRKDRLTFNFCYATVIKTVDARYDIRGYILAELVKLCLKYRAKISGGRRAFYERYVKLEALTYLECVTAELLFGPGGRLCPHEYHYVTRVESLLK
jgi:hypothetical protein